MNIKLEILMFMILIKPFMLLVVYLQVPHMICWSNGIS